MPTKLEEIIAATRARVALPSPVEMADPTAAAQRHHPRGFRDRLQRVSQSGPAIIAELKKASPSRD